MASKTIIGLFVMLWVLTRLGIRRRPQSKMHHRGPPPLERGLHLHPWVIGQPFRVGFLDDALGHMMRHQGVWATNGAQIVEWYSPSSRSSDRVGGFFAQAGCRPLSSRGYPL